ncbi:MAG: HD domain-containing protein, partial [Acidobacteriota bacterium]
MTSSCRAAIADYIGIQARPADKFSHQPRLYHLAVAIGTGLTFDDDVLYAAAWLHDIGVFVGHRPERPEELVRWDNVAYAMGKAPSLLEAFGFPAEKMSAVVEAIRTHEPHAAPTAIEGTILRDADILEKLGAVGVLRAVSKIGRDTRFHTYADALAALRRDLETLPDRLSLATARALAEDRVRLLGAFLDGADREADRQP